MATYSFNLWNHSCQWGIPATLPDQIRGAADAGYDHVGFDVPSLLAHEADGIPPEQMLVCGMSLGYPDPSEKVNGFTPERIGVEEFVTWVDEVKQVSDPQRLTPPSPRTRQRQP